MLRNQNENNCYITVKNADKRNACKATMGCSDTVWPPGGSGAPVPPAEEVGRLP